MKLLLAVILPALATAAAAQSFTVGTARAERGQAATGASMIATETRKIKPA